ncbi:MULTISPECIES: radical SAM protein [unclassified Streptomyces]|uniref:radical SAM protein n=1 Tax=Streptomyces TaxID=1883 RepID=UPI00136B9BB9|nr:radical SAM protein [Streptomyces sp. SID335]MYZ18115.1 radical SAM protein [Streptomyces sp. SID337]NDZ89488.1 radical SAM protein [Streptomyces sp. SID10115]NEA05106.1 radical SAM protein [Streptomyces sp. SID10116]NEB47760.1 radical SAM protein [Streptomyces sp. SID339]
MNSVSAPVRASVDVTYACDLRCIHCRTNTGEIPVAIRRKMMTIEQLADLLRQLDEQRTFEITLTGGEPTIRKGFWDLIEIVPRLAFSTVTLITNAANLDRADMDRIVASGISSIRVSIDGTRDTFAEVRKLDVFDQVIENSLYLQERVRSFKILTTVMKTNLANVLELTDHLRAAGFRRQDLILVRAHGRGGRNRLLLTEQETLDLYQRVERFRRDVPTVDFDLRLNAPYLIPGAPVPPFQDVVMYPYLVKDTSVAVSATGDVTMSRLYSPQPLGNVKEHSFAEIWRTGQAQLAQEQEEFDDARLREIFWDFAAADGDDTVIPLTSLLDRQIFEGYEVR